MIIVYSFGGLLLLFLILTLLAPKKFVVQRQSVIQASPHQIIGFLSNLNNYTNWNKWLLADTSVQVQVNDTPGTDKHNLTWSGKAVGKGNIRLIEIHPSKLSWSIQYQKPWNLSAIETWELKAKGAAQTEVTWKQEGNLPWPIARIMGGYIRRSMGFQYDSAFENLNQLAVKGFPSSK